MLARDRNDDRWTLVLGNTVRRKDLTNTDLTSRGTRQRSHWLIVVAAKPELSPVKNRRVILVYQLPALCQLQPTSLVARRPFPIYEWASDHDVDDVHLPTLESAS